ncbi:MAG TPA: hypothetical protein VGI39_27950, partial [Polyangiaceae bacterium]
MVAARASFVRVLTSSLLSFGVGVVGLVAAALLIASIPALASSSTALLLLPLAFLGAGVGTAALTLDIGRRPTPTPNRDVLRSILGDDYAPLPEAPSATALP